jgi:hypothetical protein
MSDKNVYVRVQELISKDANLGIGEALKKIGEKYPKYDYDKKKHLGLVGKGAKKAPRVVKKFKNSKAIVVPRMASRMETFVVPEYQEQARPTGKVIALVGSSADVTQALKDLFK